MRCECGSTIEVELVGKKTNKFIFDTNAKS